MREPCNLSAYGRGCMKVKKDRMMQERFPGASICTLLGRPLLTQGDQVSDRTLGILTPAPFGTPEYMKSVRDLDRDFYLVQRDTDQFFVTVTDAFLEIRPMSQPVTEKDFQLGSWRFVRCAYLTGQ